MKIAKLFLFNFLYIFAVLSSPVAAQGTKPITIHLNSPELDFGIMKIGDPIKPYLRQLKSSKEAPIIPTKELCEEEFSGCEYFDSKGVIYITDGIVVGTILYKNTDNNWRNSLPWGLYPKDTPSIVYRKLRALGFPVLGGHKTRDAAGNVYIEWIVNRDLYNEYRISLKFNNSNRLEMIRARLKDW